MLNCFQSCCEAKYPRGLLRLHRRPRRSDQTHDGKEDDEGDNGKNITAMTMENGLPPPRRGAADTETSSSLRAESLRSLNGQTADSMSTLQRLVDALGSSLTALGASPTDEDLERWAVLVHESMSADNRTFHRVQHVFDVCGTDDGSSRNLGGGVGMASSVGIMSGSVGRALPLQTVSAVFHDLIYYTVDGGLSPAQEEILDGVIGVTTSPGGDGGSSDEVVVTLRPSACDRTKDRDVAMVVSIFGFAPGQHLLPFGGLNEFLSAVAAVRLLSRTLNPPQLARVAACIEATIPFRPNSAFVTLHKRLSDVNVQFCLGMDDDTLVEAVKRAVGLANRDVGNFATTDRAWFLDNTWKLLPESNIPLRSHGHLYNLGDYQLALKNMEGFFSNLDANLIFHSFHDRPDSATLRSMTMRARRNVEVAGRYIRAKLVATASVAALAALTGGDGPSALFMGDLPDHGVEGGGGGGNVSGPHLGDYLPDPHSSREAAEKNNSAAAVGVGGKGTVRRLDEEVFELLAEGRKSESSFDLRNSPLSAYLYGLVGMDGIDALLPLAKVHPMDEEAARELLDSLPPGAYYKLATGCAKIAVTRAKKLQALADGIDLSPRAPPPHRSSSSHEGQRDQLLGNAEKPCSQRRIRARTTGSC